MYRTMTTAPSGDHQYNNSKKKVPEPSSAMYARPYALPNVNQLPPEDDWTGIKDPKEKKKLQNRVAQRLYRHRMKERIKILQEKLEYQETRRRETSVPMPNNSITPTTTAGVIPSSLFYPSTEMMSAAESHQPRPHLCPLVDGTPVPYQMLPQHIGEASFYTSIMYDDESFSRIEESSDIPLASGTLACLTAQ